MSKSAKRILVDTTYLLPTISFSVKGIPDDVMLRLIKNDYSIYVSSISLFELAAVGSKYLSKGGLSEKDVRDGIKAIKLSPDLIIIDHADDKVIGKALKLNRSLPDFIDRIIVATAMSYCDVLLTEDSKRIIPFLRPIHTKPIFPCLQYKEIQL
jgi:PIN domain nuclease of toxin-antitoxin system